MVRCGMERLHEHLGRRLAFTELILRETWPFLRHFHAPIVPRPAAAAAGEGGVLAAWRDSVFGRTLGLTAAYLRTLRAHSPLA